MDNSWRDRILNYRERFRRLDRKWHALIGAQLFFALAAFRYNRGQQQRRRLEEEQQEQQQQQLNSIDSTTKSTIATVATGQQK